MNDARKLKFKPVLISFFGRRFGLYFFGIIRDYNIYFVIGQTFATSQFYLLGKDCRNAKDFDYISQTISRLSEVGGYRC